MTMYRITIYRGRMPTVSLPRTPAGRVAALSLIAAPIGVLGALSAWVLVKLIGLLTNRAVPAGLDDPAADGRPAPLTVAVPRGGRGRPRGEPDREVGPDHPWTRDPRGDGGGR